MKMNCNEPPKFLSEISPGARLFAFPSTKIHFPSFSQAVHGWTAAGALARRGSAMAGNPMAADLEEVPAAADFDRAERCELVVVSSCVEYVLHFLLFCAPPSGFHVLDAEKSTAGTNPSPPRENTRPDTDECVEWFSSNGVLVLSGFGFLAMCLCIFGLEEGGPGVREDLVCELRRSDTVYSLSSRCHGSAHSFAAEGVAAVARRHLLPHDQFS